MVYANKIVSHSDIPYITTKDLAAHLQHHVSSRLCTLYVYISFEKEVVLLIVPTNALPTQDEVYIWVLFIDIYIIYIYINTLHSMT